MAGVTAGTLHTHGYIVIRIDGVNYLAHRLAWFYMTGEWPEEQIDHKDGCPSNNRWKNLREATPAQNRQSLSARRNKKSGLPMGVTTSASAKNPFSAYIQKHGQRIHLGVFPTSELAQRAYLSAKKSLHTFQPTLRRNHEEGTKLINVRLVSDE